MCINSIMSSERPDWDSYFMEIVVTHGGRHVVD